MQYISSRPSTNENTPIYCDLFFPAPLNTYIVVQHSMLKPKIFRQTKLRFSRLTAVITRPIQTATTLREQEVHVKKNHANVQLLSPNLQAQLFESYEHLDQADKSGIMKTKEDYSEEHLKLQDIWGKEAKPEKPIDIQLPKLYGKNIEEHFIRVGLEQSRSYLSKCQTLVNATLPPKPSHWERQSGWTRYTVNEPPRAVEHPLEDIMVFDVEVMVKEGNYPTMAVVATPEAWYSWTSPYLFGESNEKEHLIPLGDTRKERIVVGHNVGYDRARIAEEYSRIDSKIRYVDTMSLHIAVAGLCSQQRPTWMLEIKKRNQNKLEGITTTGELDEAKFFDVSSLNSLKDVAKFHCNVEMDKELRSHFVVGDKQEIQDNFNDLMGYCATDVLLTHNIYQSVFSKFRENCPHPVSFVGILEMGSTFLTVTDKWEDYLQSSVATHQKLEDMLDVALQDLANKANALVNNPEIYMNDPWLSQLDWFVNPRQRKLKGYPRWYKDSFDTKANKLKISIRSRIAPLLLRLKWQGFPLHHLSNFGWCYKIPVSQVDIEKIPKFVMQDEEYYYIKVPHKDGESANCGNPLAKSYMNSFEDNVLTSEYEAAREALELNAKSAYWISSRERITNQFVVWNKNQSVDMQLPAKEDGKYGMILPQMVTMGTVTRRAVERTWLTASNAKANRIGSELKSLVQAPEGYKIVGADVDSEELWISSVIGDAEFGFHGATALGWMTLQGSKSQGTDLHSKTASILGISRDKAKIFNYARIYGAGVKYATSLLMQYSQGMDPETAKQRATELYSSTKGEKQHSARNQFKRHFWHGGSESYMFNALEDIALSKEPRTPVLGCAITDALKPRYTGSQFLTSRVNWVVQSSGVDYLHLLITSMSHLIERYNINARFMLSVHDEVRYLSSEEDQHRTAMALQIANIWTRALFSYKLGIHTLPQSVAFFSAVDIDHVLRKEPFMKCLTPSNHEEISEGVSCDINDTISALSLEGKEDGETLLGDSKETGAASIAESEVIQILNRTKRERKSTDLEFLKAQMYKNYKSQGNDKLKRGMETVQIIRRKASSLEK